MLNLNDTNLKPSQTFLFVNATSNLSKYVTPKRNFSAINQPMRVSNAHLPPPVANRYQRCNMQLSALQKPVQPMNSLPNQKWTQTLNQTDQNSYQHTELLNHRLQYMNKMVKCDIKKYSQVPDFNAAVNSQFIHAKFMNELKHHIYVVKQ